MATERIGTLVGLPEVAVIVEEPHKFDPPSTHRFKLKSGNKRLAMFVHLGKHPYTATAISTNENAIKIPGATSAVYQEAADILEEIAQQHGKPIRYDLATRNDVMKLWARDQVRGGAAIFDWDSIGEDSAGTLIAKKTFGKELSLKRRVIGLFRKKSSNFLNSSSDIIAS